MSERMEGQARRLATTAELVMLSERLIQPQYLALLRNRHKGHWENESAEWLMERARQEMEELAWELDASGWQSGSPGAREKIIREAADVANFLAMIVDVVSRAAHPQTADGAEGGGHG